MVFLPIYYTEASLILTQANSMGYAPTFFGCDGLDGLLAVKNFDTKLADGVMLLTPLQLMQMMKRHRHLFLLTKKLTAIHRTSSQRILTMQSIS